MKYNHVVAWVLFAVSSPSILAVDLYLTNATSTPMLATARARARRSELVSIPPRARKVFVENITPSDTLSIYAADKDKPWGQYLISLGGQRNEPIYLPIAELQCGQFILQDPLQEAGEGGYSIQILHQDTLPGKTCPAK